MRTAAALLALLCSCFVFTLAANNDYVIDLKWPTSAPIGHLTLPIVSFGGAEYYTIEFLVNARDYGCLLDMSDPDDVNNAVITIKWASKDTNGFQVTIGSTTVSGTLSTKLAKWYQISVVVNNADGTASAYAAPAFDDNAGIITIFSNKAVDQLVNAPRIGFFGACINRASSGLNSLLDGQVDDIRFWASARVPTATGESIDTYQIATTTPGLIVQYPFNEVGSESALGLPGVSFPITNTHALVVALVGTAWSSKKSESYRTCYGWGDPHYGIPSGAHFDTEHVDDTYFTMQRCKGNAFTVKTHHVTGRYWGKATVYESMIVEAYGNRIRATTNNLFYKIDDSTGLWVPLTPSSGTLKGGVYYSYSSNYITVTAPMGGTVVFDSTQAPGLWAWVTLSVSNLCEDCEAVSVCKGNKYADLDYSSYWAFTPDCVTNPVSSSTTSWSLISESSFPEDQCDPEIWSTAELLKFEQYCTAFAASSAAIYQQCMFDCCAGFSCEPVCVDSSSTACQVALLTSDDIVPPECVPTCPCNCTYPHGTCVDDACVCVSGWTGLDCSTESSWTCAYVSADSTTDLPLFPQNLNLDLNFPVPTTAATNEQFSNWAKNYAPHVRDTLLIFTTEQTVQGVKSTSIVITASDATSRTSGQVSIQISGGSGSYIAVPSTCSYADKSTCITPDSNWDGSTLFLSWNAYSTSEAIIRNPSGPFTLVIDDAWDGQILVGSVTRYGKIDITKFSSHTISLTLGECTDTDGCALIGDCSSCAAKSSCGWCRDAESCMVGSATGPEVPGKVCANWRYSFDDSISRRLTTSFGWPVDPTRTEVFLSDSGSIDLPVELTVDIGNTENQPWDFVWLQPARSRDSIALSYYKLMAADIYSALTAKNTAWGMVKYGWGTSYDFISLLSSGRPSLNSFTSMLNGITTYTSTATYSAALYALNKISDPAVGMGWHSTAKRVVMTIVDTPYDPAFDIQTLRYNLVQRNIIPVFAATASMLSTYETLVDELGFGLVVQISDNSENIVSVINKALTRVIGNVFVLYTGGYIDTAVNADELNMWGLTNGMRARFVLPVTPAEDSSVIKTSTILVPGYGTAVIENVESDKPWTAGTTKLLTKEDYTVSVWGVDGALLYLGGKAYQGIPKNVEIVIVKGPENGTIYTFTEGSGRGDAIVVPAEGYVVTEPQGRIVYEPNADVYSKYNKPIDAVLYKVNDGCQDSPITSINIVVLGVNDAPVASCDAPTGQEDTPIVITLAGSDKESDPFKFTIIELPDEVTPSGEVGKFYQFDEAASDNLGKEITKVPTNLTDAQGRVVYVPPANANSDGIPSSLLIQPSFTFHLEETKCCIGYTDTTRTSYDVNVPILIAPVNDPPTVWDVDELSADSAICFYECTYKEDFGNLPGIEYSPAVIFVGGHDVELSELTVEVVALTCPAGALTTLSGDAVVVGTTVSGLEVDTQQGAFYFKPIADMNGSPYCTIEYKVFDGELYSADTFTITIDITPVNDLPRLVQQEVTTYENYDIEFSLEASDIDSDYVQVTFVSCTLGDVGTLFVDGNPIDCSNLDGVILSVDASSGSWPLYYSPPPGQSKLGMMTVEVELDDKDPSNTYPLPSSTHYWLTINVLAVNDGPVIALNEGDSVPSANYEYTTATPPGEALPLPLYIDDVDVGANLMALTAETDCGKLWFTWTEAALEQRQSFTEETTETGYKTSFQLPLEYMQSVLLTTTFNSSQDCLASVKVVVSDQGFVGACPPTIDEDTGAITPGARYCPLEAVALITILVSTVSVVNAALVGGVSAAGAVVGLAGAAVLFKLFRSPKHPESYSPWSMDGEGSGAVENPLYKAQDNSFENPMFNVGGQSS